MDTINPDTFEEEPSTLSYDWATLPRTVLEHLYQYFDLNTRLRASSTCVEWWKAMYAPRLWRKLHVVLESKRDSKKLRFLASVAHYARDVVLIWRYRRHFNTLAVKAVDLLNMEAIKSLMSSLKEAKFIQTLKFQFENAWSHHVDFILHLKGSLPIILKKNTSIEFLSFGGSLNVAPKFLLEDLTSSSAKALKELHIASYDMKRIYASEGALQQDQFVYDSSPYFLFKNPKAITAMTALHELSISWGHFTDVFLGALNLRTNPSQLRKLNISVSTHTCVQQECDVAGEAVRHPNLEQWKSFEKQNAGVKVSLTFAGSISGICGGLEVIRPGVRTLKLLEYDAVEPDVLGLVLTWHRESLETLVHCCVWDSVMLDNGDELWTYVSQCDQLKHLVFIGHFIPDEAVVFIANYFEETLETLVASRAHLISFAEATDYMIPISGGRYNAVKNRISLILGKPWEALSRIPLNGLYFSEGKDDVFYESGGLVY